MNCTVLLCLGLMAATLFSQTGVAQGIHVSNLNIFARRAGRARMANIPQMINVLQAMILTDKEKFVLTPTYYVFKMYVPTSQDRKELH